jgi:hypothetical protein
MPTECKPELFEFAPVEGRQVVACFDGGTITSDAGGLLLGAADGAIRLTERFASCFTDTRVAELVEHSVGTMVTQRVLGIALGYEDLIDHDELRHDPVLAVLAGKLEARRSDCAPLAGKSTLNRLELSRPEPTRYHKVSHDAAAIETLFVDPFLETHQRQYGPCAQLQQANKEKLKTSIVSEESGFVSRWRPPTTIPELSVEIALDDGPTQAPPAVPQVEEEPADDEIGIC